MKHPIHRTTINVPEELVKEIQDKGYVVGGVLERGWKLVKQQDGLEALKEIKELNEQAQKDMNKLTFEDEILKNEKFTSDEKKQMLELVKQERERLALEEKAENLLRKQGITDPFEIDFIKREVAKRVKEENAKEKRH